MMKNKPKTSERVTITDLHIYNLDAVPPVHVGSNHVDKISLPLQIADRLHRVQPVTVANHVKECQSLIERAVT